MARNTNKTQVNTFLCFGPNACSFQKTNGNILFIGFFSLILKQCFQSEGQKEKGYYNGVLFINGFKSRWTPNVLVMELTAILNYQYFKSNSTCCPKSMQVS